MKYYLGLDVGGTNLAAGIVDENYHLLHKESIPAGAGRSVEDITEDMAKVSKSVIKHLGLPISKISSWGIGMPSYINPKTGLLVHANCFGWKNIDIYSYLQKQISLPIYIENDANCAALGEVLAGAGKGYRDVLMLTLGTGLGGGIILDKKIYAGSDMMGAELGHTKLAYHGSSCTCGQLGCAEAYCSATALIRQAKEELTKETADRMKGSVMYELCGNDLDRLDAKMVVDAYKMGDRIAKKVFLQYVDYLSCALSSFIVIFRPEIIILGGGVSNAGDLLLIPLKEKVMENTYAADVIGVPEIRLAKCGNDAGIIGAAMLEIYGLDRKKNGVS